MLTSVYTKGIRDRWLGVGIGVGAIVLWLLMGVAVYRDIDLDIYREMPEFIRSLMGIAEDADVASLAVGVIFGFAGAITLSSLALSMGSASIAGEERDGTMGLLLGNPKSRRSIVLSKLGALVTTIAAGTLILYGATLAIPPMLGVSVGQMHVEAMMLHLLVHALFYGFLAAFIGAWTGDRAKASGITAGTMVLGWFAVGILPLIEGIADLARVFPWYYFDSSDPGVNGVAWGHIGLLGGLTLALLIGAVYAFDRRDLRLSGERVTIVDRLRQHPLTDQIVDRLAGSTRVSRIWIKALSEHQVLLLIATASMFLWMGVLMGPMYNAISGTLADFTENAPEAMLAMIGNADISTPEGWYQTETFSIMAPIGVALLTVAIAARGLAGEESRRTMGLLLSNPVPRSKVVLENVIAMIAAALVVGLFTWLGVGLGSAIGGLGMSWVNIAATTLLAVLLGLVIGGVALLLSATTGRVKIAVYGAVGFGLAAYLVESFLPLSDRLAAYSRWSPWHYYLSSDPLVRGLDWVHTGVLAGLFSILVVASVIAFDRRDVRLGG